ncbi:hypothetical protein N7449_010803 [Penicillium cf. viridicatum]|uniref:Uncharacterized protein n=1 Tax=Penicillium cf. viridicatum TaxID=2972119 RepID=A0A9W9M3X3_9EURO|nr:hypothetical protein N7449_010803 [Penicillium cf. viridicatum]
MTSIAGVFDAPKHPLWYLDPYEVDFPAPTTVPETLYPTSSIVLRSNQPKNKPPARRKTT